jgi:2',3'-cyclic-nucleotide 2'-phosphodiesterase (5'-nucleotidase family)
MRARVLLLIVVLVPVAALIAWAVRGDSSDRRGSVRKQVARAECRPGSGRAVTLTLFHETHTHGNLAGTPDRPDNVGFARYVALRNALASCLRDPAASLFLGNGDDVSPFLGDVFTDGRHTIEAFNADGLDADTFGFSELDVSPGRLRELVAASRVIWVSANVREAATPDRVLGSKEGARPWIVRTVGGLRVGVTGLLSSRFTRGGDRQYGPGSDSPVLVLDPAHAMREVLPEMRAAGAQVIVVLSHMIHEDTTRPVKAVDGIDVALGTHLGEATARPQRVGGAIVAVAGPDEMQALGQLDLTVRRGRVVAHEFSRHVPAATGAENPAVATVLARCGNAATEARPLISMRSGHAVSLCGTDQRRSSFRGGSGSPGLPAGTASARHQRLRPASGWRSSLVAGGGSGAQQLPLRFDVSAGEYDAANSSPGARCRKYLM